MNVFARISLISVFPCLLYLSPCTGQDSTMQYRAIVPEIIYGTHIPGGDLKERFGHNFHLGLGVSYISKKDLSIGIRGSVLFGNQVKEDVLSSILTPEGLLVGKDMQFASVFLRQRGVLIHMEVGKLIHTNSFKNHYSGIQMSAGIGTLIHKIRIVDDFSSAIQIAGPYQRGYDRLTMGFSLVQFIGYKHIDPEGLLNFLIGVEAVQGFTESLRKFNYNSGLGDNSHRMDLLFGIRLAWLLPFPVDQGPVFY